MTAERHTTDDPTAPIQSRYLARWGDETPLYEAVTDAVSTVSGDAHSVVAAQYDRAHAFALSRLFDDDTASTGVVEFAISECVVSVHSDGRLSVSPADGRRDATG